MKKNITIATRKSPLALKQTDTFTQALSDAYPDLNITILPLSTTGDNNPNANLAEIGGKALFVKELELALLEGKADIAVHSAKDMPPELHPDLLLAATLTREDARDCFIANGNLTLKDMPDAAMIGTSSPRRAALLRHYYPHLTVKPIRGSVDTRLNKCLSGEYDGIILAIAGLKRLGKNNQLFEALDLQTFIPAVGQGTIAIECRQNDGDCRQLLDSINQMPSYQCLTAERQLIRCLNGDCYSAIGVQATIQQDSMQIDAIVLSHDGTASIRESQKGKSNQGIALATKLSEKLLHQGATKLLTG